MQHFEEPRRQPVPISPSMWPTLGLLIALAAGAAGCASSGAVPRPFPGAPVPPSGRAPETAEPPSPVEPRGVVHTALGLRGAPYRNGGSDPSGFDCSGFVQYVFAQHGRRLPREVREQYQQGQAVPATQARIGDLIFFTTTEAGPSHVGLIVANREFVHAPSRRGVVRVERFTERYWQRRIVGVRRLP